MPNRAGNIIKNVPERIRRVTALGLVIGAATLTAAGCEGGGDEAQKVPQPNISTEDLRKDEVKARLALQTSAKESAKAILSKMSNPKAGAKSYKSGIVANKENLYDIEEDVNKLTFNPQYIGVPEMRATYYPDKKRIVINIAGQHGNTDANRKLASAELVFAAGDGNPINIVDGKLRPKDFITAIQDGSTNVVAVSASTDEGYTPQTVENDGGVWFKNSRIYKDFLAGEAAEYLPSPYPPDVVTQLDEKITTIQTANQALISATQAFAQDPPLG